MKPDQRFDDPLRTKVRRLDLRDDEPVAVGVPLPKMIKRRLKPCPELTVLHEARSVAAERFRQLRTVIARQSTGAQQVIVVTSGIPGDGKSTVAVNLALACASERDKPTLLLDADLRRSSINDMIEPAPQLGLGDIIDGNVDEDHVILALENSPLSVLPAGESVPNPAESLSSERFKGLITRLRDKYDQIIIDTPPIVPFTDADLVGGMSDGVLFVVRAGVTPVAVYKKGIAAVRSSKLLGTVFNGAVRNLAEWNQYYDRYYTKYYDKERER